MVVADLSAKEAVLAVNSPGVFTIEHFVGYPAVLIALEDVEDEVLAAAVLDGWLTWARAALSAEFPQR